MVLPFCSASASLLLTLKMTQKGGTSSGTLERDAVAALSSSWDVHAIEQLFANGRHERTLVARRKDPRLGNIASE